MRLAHAARRAPLGANRIARPFPAHARASAALGLALMVLACVMTHYSIRILIRVGIEMRVTTYEQVRRGS
jgi:hypothetical protein